MSRRLVHLWEPTKKYVEIAQLMYKKQTISSNNISHKFFIPLLIVVLKALESFQLRPRRPPCWKTSGERPHIYGYMKFLPTSLTSVKNQWRSFDSRKRIIDWYRKVKLTSNGKASLVSLIVFPSKFSLSWVDHKAAYALLCRIDFVGAHQLGTFPFIGYKIS